VLLFFFELLLLLKISSVGVRSVEVLAVLTLLATIVAFFTGDEGAKSLHAIPDGVIGRHHVFGRGLLFGLIPLTALRLIATRASHYRATFKNVYYVFLIGCFLVAIYTGYLGGELVFRYGVGVRALDRQEVPSD